MDVVHEYATEDSTLVSGNSTFKMVRDSRFAKMDASFLGISRRASSMELDGWNGRPLKEPQFMTVIIIMVLSKVEESILGQMEEVMMENGCRENVVARHCAHDQ